MVPGSDLICAPPPPPPLDEDSPTSGSLPLRSLILPFPFVSLVAFCTRARRGTALLDEEVDDEEMVPSICFLKREYRMRAA